MPESEKHPLLSMPDWPEIIERHREMKPADFALQFRSEYGELTPYLAEQLHCLQKAEKKLPGIHRSGWIYRKESLEQSSGAAAARYKASLFQGDVCFDLTGGLGIDSLAFAERFKTVHHVEPDKRISELAAHNLSKAVNLKADVTFHRKTAEAFLETMSETADLLYLDPSRRDETGRVFRLGDCVPDVITLKPLLNSRARQVLVKLSPLYGLHQLRREIPETAFMCVVSYKGDVREILAGWKPDESANPVRVRAVVLKESGEPSYSIERNAAEPQPELTEVQLKENSLVFMPDSALSKAGLAFHAADDFGLGRISRNLDWFAGLQKVKHFPGRTFSIREIHDYKPGPLKKRLGKLGIKSAHMYRREFPVSVPELHKKLQIPMGDDAHLLFITDGGGYKKCLICNQELD